MNIEYKKELDQTLKELLNNEFEKYAKKRYKL